MGYNKNNNMYALNGNKISKYKYGTDYLIGNIFSAAGNMWGARR